MSKEITDTWAKRVVDNSWFVRVVIGVISFNAFLIGLATYITSPAINALEWVCVAFFLVEIVIRFRASASIKAYLSDPWNWFDVIIVSTAFVPNIASGTTVLRLLRVFRVLRLVNGIYELRLIVNVLVRSLRSMAYISLLMFICFYVYAIIGTEFFSSSQPEYSTLHETFFTLFRSLTAEDWTDLRYDGLPGQNYWFVTTYHVTWILLSTFLLINLVVGAVINNYNEVQEIERHRHLSEEDLDGRIAELAQELQTLIRQRQLRNE